MSLNIKTTKLHEMLTRAVKGVGNNKMIPITSLLAIELKKNVLTLMTTDGTNYLNIIEHNVDGDDFYIVVEADTISKLIARMTCENVSLDIKENSLEVVGNGTYKIDIPLNENGEHIVFPSGKRKDKKKGKSYKVKNSTIQTILTSVKPSLAVTLEEPCYTGYYVGDSVVGTDSIKLASYNEKLFDSAVLVRPETMELLAVITDDEFTVKIVDSSIECISSNCEIYTTAMEGIEDYSIDAINDLIQVEMPNTIKLSKNEVLQALDRIVLFVGAYDKNIVNVTFADRAMVVESKATNGVESITAVSDDEIGEFSCALDVFMFQQQVKALTSDTFELQYGDEKAIKIKDTGADIIQILALASEE